MTKTAMELLKEKGQDVWSVSPQAGIIEALQLMADKNVGALLVLEGDELKGVFSERDFARRVVVDHGCSEHSSVGELMTSKVFTAEATTTVHDCMELYTEHRIRHLPIVQEGKVVGVLSIGDLVKHIISNLETTVKDLENYIAGSAYGG